MMGHTDVVPVNPDGWQRDPFAGEIVDGEIWGRGAVDMLNLTATMAVAFRDLARSGFTPKRHARLPRGRRRGEPRHVGRRAPGRARARRGAWPTTSSPRRAASRCRPRSGPRLPVIVGEKGSYWCRISVRGHARARVAAVPHRQRARHRGRGRAPARDVQAAHAHPRHVAPLHRRRRLRAGVERERCSTRSASPSSARRCRSGSPARRTRARTRRSRPRSSTAAPRPT